MSAFRSLLLMINGVRNFNVKLNKFIITLSSLSDTSTVVWNNDVGEKVYQQLRAFAVGVKLKRYFLTREQFHVAFHYQNNTSYRARDKSH
jgi:hypothetical protein